MGASMPPSMSFGMPPPSMMRSGFVPPSFPGYQMPYRGLGSMPWLPPLPPLNRDSHHTKQIMERAQKQVDFEAPFAGGQRAVAGGPYGPFGCWGGYGEHFHH
mmetsp:Transcript_86479/g.135610  ORF Transcript_86479/g.135610 Transcript_86479/m.135610 type:complete len:102 (-) Transcript_86479:10-315(-)